MWYIHILVPIILAIVLNFYIYTQGWNNDNEKNSKLPPGYIIGSIWIIILGLLGYIHFLLYPSLYSWFIVLTILYCLSYPFLFLNITRPKWCHVKYTDEHGKDVEEILHGMSARVFQHENEHMNGYVFTDLVSKFKLERAKESRKKMLKKYARGGAIK